MTFASGTVKDLAGNSYVGTSTYDFTTVVVITGTSGNDSLVGTIGNDVINGLAGNDSLNGGTGADTMIGGLGNDTYYVDNIGDVITETSTLLTEIDTVNSSISHTLGANIENLILTGSSNINGTGNSLNNIIYANGGNNVINGGNGSDTVSLLNYSSVENYGLFYNLEGTLGFNSYNQDTFLNIENLIGSNYSDVLLGDSGNNSLDGAGGDDFIEGGTGNDIINGGLGVDMVGYSDISMGVTVNLALTNQQNTFGAGSDTLISIEQVYGSYYADTLTGNSLDNELEGNDGNDSLNGGNGVDKLIGGVGKDTLTGGLGNDTFKFLNYNEMGLGTSARDTITDFTRGQDKIDLSYIDTNATLSGDQAFKFIATTTAFSVAGQIHYSGGIISINTDTDAATEYEIQLTGVIPPALAATDFVL